MTNVRLVLGGMCRSRAALCMYVCVFARLMCIGFPCPGVGRVGEMTSRVGGRAAVPSRAPLDPPNSRPAILPHDAGIENQTGFRDGHLAGQLAKSVNAARLPALKRLGEHLGR